MTADRNEPWRQVLVQERCKLPAEITWLEFKHHNPPPKTVS